MYRTVGKGGDAKAFHHLLCPPSCFLLGKAKVQRAKGDLLEDICGEKLVVRVLEYHAYLASEGKQPLFGVV